VMSTIGCDGDKAGRTAKDEARAASARYAGEMAGLADEACACTNNECALGVKARVDALRHDLAGLDPTRGQTLSPADRESITASEQRIYTCFVKFPLHQ